MSCASFGSFAKLIVEPEGSPTTFDSSSERYTILAETLTAKKYLQGRRRITGDLSQYDGAFREHSYLAQGAIVMQASAKDIHAWMPRTLWNAAGTSGGASTYTVGDDMDDFIFDVMIYKENGTFRFTDCRVARMVLRSQTEAGQQPENEELLEMILYIMGVEEDPAATWPSPEPAFPSLTGAYRPYAHWDGAFTLNSNSTSYNEFQLDINNRLVPLFYNSITPSCFRSAGRSITASVTAPFTSTALADAVSLLNTGAAASFAFTGVSGVSTTISMPRVRNMYETPNVRGKGEIPLKLELEAVRIDGSTPEITVTNDHTPA